MMSLILFGLSMAVTAVFAGLLLRECLPSPAQIQNATGRSKPVPMPWLSILFRPETLMVFAAGIITLVILSLH